MTLLSERRRRTARGSQIYTRDQITLNDWIDTPGVWWHGNDVSRGTLVQPTGSQTLTETYSPTPLLRVTSPASIATSDVVCLLYPIAPQIGDEWSCRILNHRDSNTPASLVISGVCFTNGTAATSACIMVTNQLQNNGNNLFFTVRSGTITNMATDAGGGQISSQWTRSNWQMSLRYNSANSFTGRIEPLTSVDPVSAIQPSFALTPTHVGICWSIWGTTPDNPSFEFGPLYRTT